MIALLFVRNFLMFLVPAVAMGLACHSLARASREEWQLLAWVPVLPLAAWALFIAVGVTRDPTSHNLWPLELVFWAGLSVLLLALFLLARRFAGKPRTDWTARRDRDRTT
jgi:hypothetical protein